MEKSRLLMKSKPLVLDKDLATLIGLNEALVLQQIEYWVNIKEEADQKQIKTKEQNYVDGHYWTYNTIDEWTEEFPFWSYDTVKRTLKVLRDKGYVYAEALSDWGADRTLWYRPNHEKLITLEKELQEVKRTISLKNEKRMENRKKSSQKYKENNKNSQENGSEALKTLNSSNCTIGIVQNAPLERGNLHLAITKTSTKTSTKISNLSNTSSKGEKSPLAIFFEENMGELKKTTLPKFEAYVEKYDADFIKAIIEYGSELGRKSYKWFETAIESYIAENKFTAEEVWERINKFQEENKKRYKSSRKAKEKLIEAKKEAQERELASYESPILDEYSDVKNTVDLQDAVEVTEELSQAIKSMEVMTETTFNTWFSLTKFYGKGNKIYVVAPNIFTRDKIESVYADVVNNAIKLIPGNYARISYTSELEIK